MDIAKEGGSEGFQGMDIGEIREPVDTSAEESMENEMSDSERAPGVEEEDGDAADSENKLADSLGEGPSDSGLLY